MQIIYMEKPIHNLLKKKESKQYKKKKKKNQSSWPRARQHTPQPNPLNSSPPLKQYLERNIQLIMIFLRGMKPGPKPLLICIIIHTYIHTWWSSSIHDDDEMHVWWWWVDDSKASSQPTFPSKFYVWWGLWVSLSKNSLYLTYL